jgi:hypothetical protein
MAESTTLVPLELSDGTIIKVEARISGEHRVSSIPKQSLKKALRQVKSLSLDLADSLNEIRKEVHSTKATVEFGLEMSLETGALTTLLAKGSGKTNVEITLEWEDKP